jgi:DAK2 domain fusion protein YloV
LVRRCEWLMLMPKEGCFPHTSQTAAIRVASVSGEPVRSGNTRARKEPLGNRPKVSIRPAMSQLERLEAEHLRAAVSCYRDALQEHKEVINRLNVYPVPDGDTGTNMALTLESVVSTLNGAGGSARTDMASTCQAIAHGSLMGARGNSGVILSQVLRGLTAVCSESDAVGPEDLARALRSASESADGAVSRPVEGTILTVARAVAEAAEEATSAGKALVDVLEAARTAGSEALERTPDMLPVLKEAGVVDAGGMGLLLLVDALLHVGAGRPLPPPDPSLVPDHLSLAAHSDGGDGKSAEEVDEQRYEVMFFLEAEDEAIPGFREGWSRIGDSVALAGGDGTWNCHIHTNDVGRAIEAALDTGRPRNIRVTDLKEQIAEESCAREAAPTGEDALTDADTLERVKTAVVAVGNGPGIVGIFRSLGVQKVVEGGQTMNPSTAELLEAVEAAPADEVVVLPNNKNIVPVAERVVELAEKKVRVVATQAVPEGLAALLDYHPGLSLEDNVSSMEEAVGHVAWGEVTTAVRASSSPAGPIAEGDWLGLTGEGVAVVAGTLVEATQRLVAELLSTEHELVTLIEGEGASESDTHCVTEWVEANCEGVTVEVHHGGQPHYPYLISVE